MDRANSTPPGVVDGPTQVPSSDAWYSGGERVTYDPHQGAFTSQEPAGLNVFVRREGDVAHAVSFLPGFPDGSFGWAKVLPYLPGSSDMGKLFVDYVGMGDSDKPKDYQYSTAERTDLVEAVWRGFSIQSTTLVAFDFSSLVVLEHLRRRLERTARGEPAGGPKIRGVFIFNGGLFVDGHTHPWYTTPLLRRLPKRSYKRLGKSFRQFKMMMKVMWSKGYRVTDAEIRELQKVLGRHDGAFFTAAAAGFVLDHQAEAKRLDFGEIFKAFREEFPFFIGGSDEDPFEHRQVDLVEERLVDPGLQVKRLPGGHLTTGEQPEALAKLITSFERGITTNARR